LLFRHNRSATAAATCSCLPTSGWGQSIVSSLDLLCGRGMFNAILRLAAIILLVNMLFSRSVSVKKCIMPLASGLFMTASLRSSNTVEPVSVQEFLIVSQSI